jgi:ATP-dependent helicase/nuclease subunit A
MLTPRDRLFARGRLIHRLLQSLPDVLPLEREAKARSFLAQPQHLLDADEQAGTLKEILALFENAAFASLFGPESRAEVPLVGRVGDQLISGQIDRLCVLPDEVWIVDYKTNRPPPEKLSLVPEIYLKQMAAYRAVLREIYPDKAIKCFLLWTHVPQLMALPEALLPLVK